MSIDTLAKVDLYCQFDGAVSPLLLARLARDAGLPEGGDLLAVQARIRATDLASLQANRAWVRSLLTSEEAVEAAALDLGRRMIAEVVVHLELHVDPTAYGSLTPMQVLQALDRGFETSVTERDDVFLSWTLIPELRRNLSAEAALALVEEIAAAGLEHVAGIAVGGDDEKTLSALHLKPALDKAGEHGLARVVVAGDHGGKARVAEALELGAKRIVGGIAALQNQELLLQLRAHRTPVVLAPTLQTVTGAVRSMASHPMKKMKEAGLFLVMGSAWPELLGTSVSGEMEQLSKHHSFRLDDLRNLTTRGIEAAFMTPNLRFHLARTVEIWRHRPLVQAQIKDGYGL